MGMFHEKLLNLVHLPLKVVELSWLSCATRWEIFSLFRFLLVVFLNVDDFLYVLLFAVFFEIFSMSGLGRLRIKKASIVFVLTGCFYGISGLAR